MKIRMQKRNGQTMVEYIIVVVVIALAAIAIFGLFGDTIRQKLGAGVEELGGDSAAVQTATSTEGAQYLKDL